MRQQHRSYSIGAIVSLLACFVCSTGTPVLAVTPAAKLLPSSTCVYVSIPDMGAFRTSFNETQLGQLAQDPVMKPFAEDLAAQLKDRFGKTDIELGIKWDELKGVYSGEVCLARVQPGNDKAEHATMLLLDVRGKDAAVTSVRETLATNMKKRGAESTNVAMGKAMTTLHRLPLKRGELKKRTVFITVHEDQLLVSNHQGLIADVIGRIDSKKFDGSLSEHKIFNDVMNEVDGAAGGLAPQARWFVDPFKYAEVIRASRRGRKGRGKNFAKTLSSQGFDAIRAAGGHINMSADGFDLLHRTFVFAPPVTDAPTKFNAAARMLFFPATKHLPIPKWMPNNASNYLSVNWKILDGFNHAISLIDQVAESDGFVEQVLTSFKTDKEGPEIDIRTEFLAKLDDHIVTFSNFEMPISTTSERVLVAIRIKDDAEDDVNRALKKLGDHEPQANPLKVAGHDGWEIVAQADTDEEDLSDINLPGTGSGIPLPGGEVESEEEDDLTLPNAAIVVSRGGDPEAPPYLFIASHVDLLEKVLTARPEHDALSASDDFKAINEILAKLGAGEDSVRFFSRTDEEFRLSYEMIRQGKMPQSESMLGKLLNKTLGDEDSPTARKPEIDGSKLPDYQVVRRYLGPTGVFVQPHDNGWSITGVMVSKDQLLDKDARVQARLTTANPTK